MRTDDGANGERDRRAMAFLRQAHKLRGLAPGAVDRIERRLDGRIRKAQPRRLVLALSAAAIALVAGGAFALAHVGWRNLPFLRHVPASPSGRMESPASTDIVGTKPVPGAPAAPSHTESSVGNLPAAGGVTDTPPSAGAKQAESAEPKHTAAARKKIAMRALPEENPAPAPEPKEAAVDPILAESQSFAAALERWHRDRSASGALAALDAYEHRFPKGRLTVEARVLRAEVLLAEGRERESLQLLDRLSLTESPRARELLTVRGELRVKFGRCSGGRADLDEVMRKGGDDGFAKRARQALGHCP